jgi:hypothetical protein
VTAVAKFDRITEVIPSLQLRDQSVRSRSENDHPIQEFSANSKRTMFVALVAHISRAGTSKQNLGHKWIDSLKIR